MTESTLRKFSVLLLSPLLMAPTCLQKSIHPTFCQDPGCPASTPSPEQRLQEVGANAVLVLGISNWNVLEPCNACDLTDCAGIHYPTNIGRHTQTVGGTSYKCSYDTTMLDAFLAAHVDPIGTRPRRNFMVQIAPVFHIARVTPAYLTSSAFSSSFLQERYRALLSHVVPRIMTHAVVGENVVAIGLGNEVNAWLNSQPSPSSEWSGYGAFVTNAKAHIDSLDTNPLVTVSTTWFGACGIGDYLSIDLTCSTGAQRAYDLMNLTDFQTYTYYPTGFPACSAQPLSCYASGGGGGNLSTRVANDFGYMHEVGAQAQKFVVIQEAGYPSTATGASQNDFVNALFAQWANYDDRILGLNYFNLYDFNRCFDGTAPDPDFATCAPLPPSVPDWFYDVGFFEESGGVKSSSTWSNFTNLMNAVVVP